MKGGIISFVLVLLISFSTPKLFAQEFSEFLTSKASAIFNSTYSAFYSV